MSARVKLPDALTGLTRSELERVIYEAAMSRDDTLIATRYIVEKVPQIDIAVELGWDRWTISHRMPEIFNTVSYTAKKLFP